MRGGGVLYSQNAVCGNVGIWMDRYVCYGCFMLEGKWEFQTYEPDIQNQCSPEYANWNTIPPSIPVFQYSWNTIPEYHVTFNY
jgi:hypothetical protein